MRRVLILAYYFPPLGGVGSLRVTGFAQHLPELGWETRVVAPRDGAYYRDPELRFPEHLVVRTGSLELSRAGKRLLRTDGDDVRAARVGGARGLLRDAARSLLYFPDAQVGWYGPALLAARRELRRRSYDAILSSSFPITAHLVARRLQRSSGLPWVADFRDPWSAMMPAGPSRSRAARLERSLAHAATAVTMTSPSWAEHHARSWARPVDVIPNGHDFSSATTRSPSSEFVLGYLGTYYPQTQDLSAACMAIRRIADRGGPAVDRVRFIGVLHPQLRAQFQALRLGPLVHETGFVPHGEALEHLFSCSALLLAGPSDASGILRGHVVGKIPEYLASGLPIVYVGDPDCDAADLIRSYPGCYVCAADDVGGVVRALTDCRSEAPDRDVAGLSRRALTVRLADLLQHVAARR